MRVMRKSRKHKEIELELASFNAQGIITEFRRNLLNYGPPKDGTIRVSPGVIEILLARLKCECPGQFAMAEKTVQEDRLINSELGWETYAIQPDPQLDGYDIDWGVKQILNTAKAI